MLIKSLQILKLAPFQEAQLEFKTPHVHLFTGPNGSGKSRLLELIAAGLVLGKISSPRLGQVQSSHSDIFINGTNSARIQLTQPAPKAPCFAFSGNAALRESKIQVMQAVAVPNRAQLLSFANDGGAVPATNQAIANLKVQAAMEAMNDPDGTESRWISVVDRLEKAISEITGRKFSIIATAHPEPKLEFKWGNERLPISGLPDGLNAVLSWMVYAGTMMDLMVPKDSTDPLAHPSAILLDEPETHLHPEWQRRVIPLAQLLFPQTQFFIATHSPFVVSSVNEGYIYKIERTSDGTCRIGDPEPTPKGDSYISALSEVLNLKEWFDPETESLLDEFRIERNAALKGDKQAAQNAESLGAKLCERGSEIANIVGAELSQLSRALSS